MEFQLCQNDQVFANERLCSQDLWNIPGDGSMDNNDEYFGWTNELKIDEDKFPRANEDLDLKNPRKRKLSASSSEPLKIKTVNAFKTLRDPLTSLEDPEKPGHSKRDHVAPNGTSRMPTWQVDDISDLNADLEGSLTSLGGDLTSNSYNMSETILALPGIPVFKQEAPSPTSTDAANLQQGKQNLQTSACLPLSISHNAKASANDASNNQNMFNNTLHHLLGATYSSLQNAIDSNMITSPTSLSQDGYNVSSSSNTFGEDCRFQYVLAAATSIATKVNEDTLTYLNQGQSYEIKLKKLGDLSTYRGKIMKSVIRICFHERRLQYMEREQMQLWQQSRPGDRILEVDVPLSYGLCDVQQPTNALNTVIFTWDPTKEVGVYIKVNCISTEFTPKKHGGEKGVPFRIQVETYQASERLDASKRLHAAACQIKVFKLKGADRKHKQDREKILKRPVSEQEKFQPSYECTVLNDIPLDAVVSTPPSEPATNVAPYSPESDATQVQDFRLVGRRLSLRIHRDLQINRNKLALQRLNTPNLKVLMKKNSLRVKHQLRAIHIGNINSQNRGGNQLHCQVEDANLVKFNQQELSPATSNDSSFASNSNVLHADQLVAGSNPQITSHWLTVNRFDKYLATFANFCGADMLRMSRDDLIQICGHADGIRLYNALHSKTITPKLTIYVCRENTSVFNAIFLSNHNNVELLQKLSSLTGIPQEQIRDIYMQGPQSIHIQLNNDVIKHIKEETMFSLEIMQDNGSYIFVLKPMNK